jgi:hypothetical protein
MRQGELFAPGQPLDTSKYYIILPDSIGHGKSAKPSDGLRAKFPRYNYEDMVDAQYRLVTERDGAARACLQPHPRDEHYGHSAADGRDQPLSLLKIAIWRD